MAGPADIQTDDRHTATPGERQRRVRLFKDPVSALTHFAGFLAAVVGLVLLVLHSAHDIAKVTSMAIYGGTLSTLFLASSAYHFFDVGERGNRWLRRLDHAAIFLLIAGSYVPPLLHLLDGGWRVAMLAAVAVLAAGGIVFKLVWIDCPDWLGTAIYLGLGWLVVVPAHRILPQLSGPELTLLLAGGALYTLGSIVFVLERPDPWPRWFGHHEIWHLFVLGGAAAHFMFMVQLLDTQVPPA